MRTHGYSLIIRDSRYSLLACLLFASILVTGTARANLAEAEQSFQKAQYSDVIRQISAASDKSLSARFLLGKAQYQTGEFDASASTLQAVASMPDAKSTHYNWLGRAYGMQAERANPFSAMGLAKKARDAFEKAAQLDASNLEAASDLFSYYLAAPSFLGGGLDKAHALAERVKALNPAEYAGMQAQLAEKEKNYAKAESQYREAIRLDAKRIGRWIDLAKFYTRREQHKQADDALSKGRALQPSAPRLLYDEADLLYRSKREPSRALQLLRKYQQANHTPDDPSPYETKQLTAKLEKLEKDTRSR